ncbi:MAG TPA: hypothetical protein VMW75_02595 [Thermoanaerobaculia bacterium]|nr:hypothetical protein [Thermoanaerobaculia bacterium]
MPLQHAEDALARLRRYCGGPGGKPGPCSTSAPVGRGVAGTHQLPKAPENCPRCRAKMTPDTSVGASGHAQCKQCGHSTHFDDGMRRLERYFATSTPGGPMAGAETFAESITLPEQEIFATGTHRGKDYTHRDLDEMVANFKRFSTGKKPLLRVPAVIGHEENQEFLDRSDLPAAGWMTDVTNVKEKCPDCGGSGKMSVRDRESQGQGTLMDDHGQAPCPRCVGTGVASTAKATFKDVPRQVARLLKRRAYATVSAEIYDKPPEGIPGEGKCFRRVAFLGGEIPALKSLDDINDLYEHAEDLPAAPPVRLTFARALASKTPGAWVCFSEVQKMDPDTQPDAGAGNDRESLIAKLEGMGFSREVLDKADDALLAEILRVYDTAQNPAGEEEGGQGDEFSALPPGQNKAMWAKAPANKRGKSGKGDYDDMDSEWAEQEHDLLGGLATQPRAGETPVEELLTATQDEAQFDEDQAGQARDTPRGQGDTFELPEPRDEAQARQFRDYAMKMARQHRERGQRIKKMCDKYAGDAFTTGGAPAGGGRTAMNPAAGQDGRTRMDGPDQAQPDPKLPERGLGYNLPPAGGNRSPKKVTMSAQYQEQLGSFIRSEIKRAFGKEIGGLQQFREEVKAGEKLEAVDAILRELRDQGKVAPAELTMFREILVDADRRAVVAKFTEKGKVVPLTRFDQIVRQLRQRPSRFAERFKEAVAGTALGTGGEDATAWAERTYDAHAAAFKKTGAMKRKEFVDMAKKAEDEGTLHKFREQWDKMPAAA